MKILSLFDGMACGMLAMKKADVPVDTYIAYEIDKYANQTSKHNFPMIEQMGDVFTADFSQYSNFDYLVGGSPCTYWSIAQTKNRETVASGMGWDLFSQYVRALKEAKPKAFIYENNKSMSAAIKQSITEAFGFEPICINSALVSAQNRQRLYWVGIRQADGTYKKVDVEQPEDKGIMLKDILETGRTWQQKAYTVTTTEYKGSSVNHNLEKHIRTMVADPVCVAQRGKNPDNPSDRTPGAPTEQRFETHTDGKTNTLTTVSKDNLIAEPVKYCTDKNVEHLMRDFGSKGKIIDADSKTPTLCAAAGTGGGNGIYYGEKVNAMQYSLESVTDNDSGVIAILDMAGQEQIKRVYSDNGKAPTLTTCQGGHREPKVFCTIDGLNVDPKTPVYEVKDGLITVKGKQYPIKLVDGFYIIRKLTVTECKRLQTVPDDYEFPVSNSQAYKMLGNGWTIDVITHLIRSVEAEKNKNKDAEVKEMELRINNVTFPDAIEFNYDEIKAEITEKVSTYKALVYSENEIKDAKKDRANLNKFVKALSDERIRIKRECLKPYEEFEKKIKELSAIVQEPIDIIDSQVKAYEEKLQAEKRDAIAKEFDDIMMPYDMAWIKLEQIFDDKWLNASVSMAAIKDAIFERLQKIKSDIELIENLGEYGAESVEIYKNTLDTNKALEWAKKRQELDNKKSVDAEAQAKAAQELQKIEDQATKMREMAAQMAAEQDKASPKVWVKFAAEMTKDQALALKAFFESNNINYKAI